MERIAQMLFIQIERVGFTVVEEFPQSKRGTGGFGSTGRL
jgi:dUTP pyrophosphatase